MTSVVGLSSIAATVVLGTIVAQAVAQGHGGTIKWLIAMGTAYLALQLCNAIAAAIRGLSRRGYKALTAADVFPQSGEAKAHSVRRQILACLDVLDQHRALNNDKVTQMALAHTAITNFIWALLGIALAVTSLL